MTQELNPRCIQLEEVVYPEYYVDLILEGHLPLQDHTSADSNEPRAEG
jgi:hypothetical protein